MGYLGIIKLGANLTFYANTHTPSTGAAVDADAVPGYRVYEDETATPLLTSSMAKLDDDNTVGFYSEQIGITTANGFEAGKSYCIRITGVVGSVTGVEVHQFDVSAALLDDIESQTDDIGVAGAGLTAIPTVASVASVDTVEAIGVTGLATIAAAVWDRLTSALTTAGSVGAYLLSKLGLITPANVTVQSPVASNLNVTTYQGDDYLAEDGRALLWTVASPATLMGGTASVVIDGVGTQPATVLSETSIQCELTHAQTAAIPRNIYEYSLTVTQADGDVITLVIGRWNSKSKPVAGGTGVII